MLLMQLLNVCYEVQGRTLFSVDHLEIYEGDYIGLVGRNGSGKTSLLKVMAGLETPATGIIARHVSVSMLPQIKPMMGQKSGGEISQTVIHQILLQDTSLLLADEPTTYLDLEHVEWLEKQFKQRQGAIVLVSHDRTFLDALCTKIWEIEEGQIRVYSGNYTEYDRQKEEARKQHDKEYEKYMRKKRQLEEAMVEKERKAQRAVKKPKKISSSEAKITGAKPYFAKKQKKLNQGVQSIRTRIQQLEKVEKRKEPPPICMKVVHEEKLKNRTIIRGEKVVGRVGDRILFQEFDFSVAAGEKIAIIGSNGSGKTTFLRMILDQAAGISISPAVSIGYFDQMLQGLDLDQTILENVNRTSYQDQSMVRTVLARLGFSGKDVFKPVSVLSGGERVKIALAKLLVSHANVLILDEPTSYLDLEAIVALESLFQEYSGTILFVSHDRRFLETIPTRIFAIQNQRMDPLIESYQDYINPPEKIDPSLQDELLKIEIKITDVLNRLSLESSPELEQEFQQLLKQKNHLKRRLENRD